MTVMSLDNILDDFDPKEQRATASIKDGGPVTIWLPAEYKARYDRLQQMSKRRFCKKVRELIQAAIELTESKAG